MISYYSLFISLYCVFLLLNMKIAAAGELIPFALPWDDSSPSIIHRAELLDPPAGKSGFIRLEGERFTDANGKPIRFLGVNLAFSANFPTHEQAEKVAARMAKYGINCVRFHHMDTQRAPNGIWKAGVPAKQELDPENLDRLDYFIYQLKLQGIYVNLNLKVAREFVSADGIPDANRLPVQSKGPDYYHPRMLELQRDYARDLLTHVNPYTKTAYIDEPAVAMIEINNESGLLQVWHSGDLDDLPEHLNENLQQMWNKYLLDKYSSTDALRSAWQEQVSVVDQTLFEGMNGWTLQTLNGAQANRQIITDTPTSETGWQVTTIQPGELNWYVQLLRSNLKLQQDAFYKFSAWMKADGFSSITIGIRNDFDPWENLDRFVTVNLDQNWKPVEVTFTASADSSNARLDISGLGAQQGMFSIASPKLILTSRDGLPEDITLEEMNIPWIKLKDYGAKSPVARNDWIRFLIERETEYYQEMVDYIRTDLGAKSLIAGTQLDFGVLYSQLAVDYIDKHGYWQHPQFPGTPWDSENWLVDNVSIVNERNNTLSSIMKYQLADRAYTVSEYNHPSPNTYSSEGIPLIAAYGAFHDWDGIFYFAYSHSNDFARKSINNFFDIAGNTPKMLALPAAANLFIRGDIAKAQETYVAVIPEADYVESLVDSGGNTWLHPYQIFEYPLQAPYQHRTVLEPQANSEHIQNPTVDTQTTDYLSDTGELLWNFNSRQRSYVLIMSPRTKGMIGSTAGSPYDLKHNVSLEIGETLQQWANVLLTFIESGEEGEHWLLTASGYAENTGMQWKNSEENQRGTQLGVRSPTGGSHPFTVTVLRTDCPSSAFFAG